MKIKLYISKEGYVALACEGVFTENIEKVTIDKKTRLFSLVFTQSNEKIELDSPVDDEMITVIEKQEICGIGLYDKGEMLASAFVPMEMEN